MNRQIKYRVWTGSKMESNVVVGRDGAFYALIDKNDTACLSPTSKYHPDTPIMQFTGLKDQTGQEIYEGDIVTTIYNDQPDLRYAVVEYDSVLGSFRLKTKNDLSLPIATYRFVDGNPTGIRQVVGEILGNIFENKETSYHYQRYET